MLFQLTKEEWLALSLKRPEELFCPMSSPSRGSEYGYIAAGFGAYFVRVIHG